MARQLRFEYAGALHHVYSRGNSKREVFLEDADYKRFLRILRRTIEKHSWLCHGYCLMTNHYHLLIQTPGGNLSVGMKDLLGMYTQAFNYWHSRTGHVFEGRFKSKVVEDDLYLLTVTRYLALNPVASGLAADPCEWKWSSFNGFMGERGEEVLTTSFILSYFDHTGLPARQVFRDFVVEGLTSEGFAKPRPGLSVLIPPGTTKAERPHKIDVAFHDYDYSQREIAVYLGIHHTTVGRILRRQQ